MFEARITQGNLLKKLIDSIKDLVSEANFDCNKSGFELQACSITSRCHVHATEHACVPRSPTMTLRAGAAGDGFVACVAHLAAVAIRRVRALPM
jgi:hypothetical protein